jgi:site-specific recombinase XerD
MRLGIQYIAKKLDIKQEICWHTSRHTFATIFLRNTHDLAALQKALGHANIRETMKYSHTNTEDLSAALDYQARY